MAFYARAMDAMTPQMENALAGTSEFEAAVEAIMAVKFAYFLPNRTFLGALLGHSADTRNRLSPFSEATRHIRELDQAFFARAIRQARDVRVPEDLAVHLPKLMWLYQMGLILYWIYDRSPKQRQTALLRRKSLALVVSLLKMSRFALLKPLRSKVVDLIVVAEGGGSEA
jgi:AcrR family transcriptional regulator